MKSTVVALSFVCCAAACKDPAPASPYPPGSQGAPGGPAQLAAAPEDLARSSGGFHPVVNRPDLAPPPRADTMNGDRNGPKQSDFEAVESDGQRKVQACFDTAKWSPDAGSIRVAVRFTVGNDGKVKEAQIDTTAPADTTACIRTAVEGMTFPKFEGNQVRASFQSTFGKGA